MINTPGVPHSLLIDVKAYVVMWMEDGTNGETNAYQILSKMHT